jgi:Flp pilus assembly protein TadD
MAMRKHEERSGGNLCGLGLHSLARVLILPAVLLLSVSTSFAQNSGPYQQTILAIQQQIEANDLDDARTLIVAAARKYPHDGGLDNLLGVVEIQQGRTAEASKAFSAAILHSPRLAAAYLNLSRIEMRTAATDQAARAEALRLSLKVLQFDSANDEASYQAATILFWNKDYQPSLDHLKKLSAQADAQVGAQALLCADHAALGQREATSKAAAALAANPDLTEQDADTCLPALRDAHRADLIEPLFAAVVGHQALSPAGLRILGLAQEAEGKLQPARATLENAFAADSKSVVILEDLTRVAKAANDNEGALGYLAHARDLQPDNPELPYEFGVICVRMGLFAEARKAIAESLRLAPDNPDYNLGMGMVISFSEDPSQALPYLKHYHELRPQDPEGLLALGTANFRAKDYDDALEWLKQAVANRKTASDADFYLGRIARLQGHMDEAIGDLKQSLALRPDQPDVLAELGQIYVFNRDYPRAAPPLERATQLDPDNYAANFGLLQLYARTGAARREQQSKRFEEVKDKKDERDRQMMRAIELRPDGDTESRDVNPK